MDTPTLPQCCKAAAHSHNATANTLRCLECGADFVSKDNVWVPAPRPVVAATPAEEPAKPKPAK